MVAPGVRGLPGAEGYVVTYYLSINSHTIRRNTKLQQGFVPPIRVAKSPSDKRPQYAHEVEIVGSSRLIYTPTEPLLACGARLTLVCDDVKIVR
jgi:hypothetical protein